MTSTEHHDVLAIDGSRGEGGGQILRTSLALAVITGRAFEIHRIRAGRSRPGLLRQHLAAVRAAAAIADADLRGDELGASALYFRPRTLRGGAHRFAVGSAGSATLVLQTVLPALLRAREPSELVLEGGTHNPAAPTFDFLARSFAPALASMGGSLALRLERPGFYPAGGGVFHARIEPGKLGAFTRSGRGDESSRRAIASIAGLPARIAERELAVCRAELGVDARGVERVTWDERWGPGNVVRVELTHAASAATSIFTAFGERGVRAEDVARSACRAAIAFASTEAAVCEHLADQMLLPMALGEGGSFTTTEPSLHTLTQIDMIRLFLDRTIEVSELGAGVWRIDVR